MSDTHVKRVDHIFKKANCREILEKIMDSKITVTFEST